MQSFLYPFKRDHAYVPTRLILEGRHSLAAAMRALYSLLAFFLFSTYVAYGQNPCPTGNCTSGDVKVVKVDLVAANGGAMPNICPPDGQPIKVKLKVTFDVTSDTRYGFLIIADVYLNGQRVGKIWQCYPEEYSSGPHTVTVDKEFSWPCGSTIELRDVFIAWNHKTPASTVCTYLNEADGTLSNCSEIDPKCNYYGSTTSFTVAGPLIPGFTATGSCSGNTLYAPITFSSPASGEGSTTGGNKPYQYSWQVKDAVTNQQLTTATGSSFTYQPGSANDLLVTLTVTDASTPTAAVASLPRTIQVVMCCTAPVITSTPRLQSICAGAAASFSVGHSGGSPDPVIRWEVSTDGALWTPLADNSLYSNTSTATLNITGASAAMDGYQYRAVLKSGACAEVTSSAGTLNVSPITVGGTVSQAQTVCVNSAPANALALSRQTGTVVKWQRSTDGFASNRTDISSTNTTLSAAEIGALAQDTWFRAIVKSGECAEEPSGMVKISVSPATVGGAVSGAQEICRGSQPTGNLSLSGHVGSVLKWQRSTSPGFTTGVSDMEVTATTLSGSTIGSLTQDTWFRAVVKSGACGQEYSEAVKITVDPLSVGGSVSGAQTVCSGSKPANFLTLSGNTGAVVRWQRSTDAFADHIANIEIASATLTPDDVGSLTQDTWFRAVVKSGLCESVESGSVKITVQQPLSNNTVSSAKTICSATTPAALTGTLPSGGDGDYKYQWEWATDGGFSAIPGATGKDHAPGPLDKTTHFRRVVTAGEACHSSTSEAITITISPESEVYPLQGSNYCATADTRGTVTLGDSYPGVSYQLMRASDRQPVQDPKTGTGSMMTWTDVPGGRYYVKGTGAIAPYCTSQTVTVTVHEFDCQVLYTLTQGYYGSTNGKSCLGSTPISTILYLLDGKPLTVGTNKWLTVPADLASATKLNSVLPGGQTAKGLLNGTGCYITSEGCLTRSNYLSKQDRLNNVLLSQTFTLGLNARWKGGELLLFPIRSGYLTTQAMTGCQEDAVVVDVCSGNTVSSILMNEKVVRYFNGEGTVADLLQLANDVLGGTKEAGKGGVPTYNDINEAVDAINKSFDKGRRFLDYYPVQQTCESLFPAAVVVEPAYVTAPVGPQTSELTNVSKLAVKAYPNPFTEKVRFDVEVPQAGHGSLELFNTLGQKVTTVYQGFIPAGRQQWEARISQQQASSLIYVLTLDGKQVTGKIFRLTGY